MGLIDSYGASLDPRVIAQVQAAIHLAASNVYSEASTVAGHTTRAAFAHQVANGTANLGPLILDAVSFATLTPASTDATVSNAVSALWNEWAGV